MASSPRRLAAGMASLLVLGGAGTMAWLGAQAAATLVETQARQDVETALQAAGQRWVEVTADGLQVHLTGTAPSEVDRFRAVTQAGSVVDPARLVDRMILVSTEDRALPEFTVEVLRNDAGVSLIGLVPAETDRAAMVRRLRGETAAPQITDLLEAADHPVPPGWDAAVRYGLGAVQMAAQAKVSIRPGQVSVSAIADSPEDRVRLESALRRALPPGLALVTDISAPRPVIAPFVLRFVLDKGGGRLDPCAADTETGRDRIVAAAMQAGISAPPDCTLGLGAPSPAWADAAAAAIGAVAAIGGGMATLSDADVHLSAPPGTDRAAFDRVATGLRDRLPPPFALQAVLESPPEDTAREPAAFSATLLPSGALSLAGAVGDDRMRDTVESVASARFGTVQGDLSGNPLVPDGWTLRLIGAIEALGVLQSGHVAVTPDLIRLSGVSGDPAASDTAAGRLAERLGPGLRYEMEIRYDRRLDPSLNLPDGPECVRRLNIVMSESEIGFEPSKATIAGDPAPTLDRLAEVMTECADFAIEAGGHTDSQGSEGFNADLSRSRAQALMAAMAEAGIDTANLTARGYGESRPIAGNDTDEGREENRRIEFRLLSDSPVRQAALAPPVALSGVTREPQPAKDDGGLIGPVRPPDGGVRARASFGPPLPQPLTGPVAPAVVGAAEVFETLDAREENLRLPVRTPTADTPRPVFRPDVPGTGETP